MFTIAMAGSVVALACLGVLAWAFRQMRREFQSRLSSLSAAVQTLEENAVERANSAKLTSRVDKAQTKIWDANVARPVAVPPPAVQESAGIPVETQAAIAATISSFLGHKVRIRSVRQLETPDAVTIWTTQGRVAIHESHNERASRG